MVDSADHAWHIAAMRWLALLVSAFTSACAPAAAAELPRCGYRVLQTYPHDSQAFTQGLFYRDGFLFESTGLEGRSTIRKVRLADGETVRQVALPPTLFGEGIVDWGDEIINVTWRGEQGFRWKINGFARTGTFRYAGEGWGLTRDARSVILSDGTPRLRFLDPLTMRERRSVTVTADGKPVAQLNELEWVKGEILANIWQTDLIARIDPATGKVKAWIDLAALRALAGVRVGGTDDVLNGIAYDARTGRLFVTGKNWPKLFQIDLTDGRPAMDGRAAPACPPLGSPNKG